MLKAWLQTLLSAIGVAILWFLVSVVTARALGPEGRGLYASAMLIATLSASIAQMGLGSAYVYHKRINHQWHWQMLLSYAGFSTAVIAIALSLATRSVAANSAELATDNLTLLATSLALSGLLLNASQIDPTLKIYNIANLSVPASLLIGLLLIWQANALDVQTALWAQFLAVMIGLLILLLWSVKDSASSKTRSSTTSLNKQILSYTWFGIKFHSTVLLGILLNNIDKLYLYFTGSIKDFGFYSVAYGTSRLIGTLQETLSTTIFSKFSGKENLQAADSIQLAFRLTFVPLLFVAIILGLLGPWLLEFIYGAAFAAAGIIFAVLMIECVIGNSSWLLAQQFNTDGKPGLVFIRQAVSAILVITLLPFIPEETPLIGVALLLMLGSTTRLAMTLLLFPFVLHQPMPRLLPTMHDVATVLSVIRTKINKCG